MTRKDKEFLLHKLRNANSWQEVQIALEMVIERLPEELDDEEYAEQQERLDKALDPYG